MLVNLLWNSDPALGFNLEVDLPEGYYRVWRGAVKPGDLWLNRVKLLEERIVEWCPITDSKPADEYCCLIRIGKQVTQECERCKVEPRRFKHRFCLYCQFILRDQHKRSESC